VYLLWRGYLYVKYFYDLDSYRFDDDDDDDDENHNSDDHYDDDNNNNNKVAVGNN
jgi:hypothetical protein